MRTWGYQRNVCAFYIIVQLVKAGGSADRNCRNANFVARSTLLSKLTKHVDGQKLFVKVDGDTDQVSSPRCTLMTSLRIWSRNHNRIWHFLW